MSGAPCEATISLCSCSSVSSGCSSYSSKRPCSYSTLRLAQLGSPVVVALRATSACTTLGSTRVVPTGPAQAASATQSTPIRTERERLLTAWGPIVPERRAPLVQQLAHNTAMALELPAISVTRGRRGGKHLAC